MGETKIVLVFDLDETLSGQYPLPYSGVPILNNQLIDLIKEANKQKRKTVDAIFLLTNNSDENFIKACVKGIGENIFDYIMTANSKAINIKTLQPYKNTLRTNGANKTIEDIKYMLNKLGKSTENIFSRCYFFDDNNSHPLSQIDNFIFINPPFNRTNGFSPIPEEKLEKVRMAIQDGYNSSYNYENRLFGFGGYRKRITKYNYKKTSRRKTKSKRRNL